MMFGRWSLSVCLRDGKCSRASTVRLRGRYLWYVPCFQFWTTQSKDRVSIGWIEMPLPPRMQKPSSPLGWLYTCFSRTKNPELNLLMASCVGWVDLSFQQLGEVGFFVLVPQPIYFGYIWLSKTWNKWVNSFRKMLVIYQLKLSLVPQPTLKSGVCSVLSELLNMRFLHIGTKTLTKLFALEKVPHPRCVCSVCRGMKKYVLIFDTFDVWFQQCFKRDHCVYGFASRKKTCVLKVFLVHLFLYMVSSLGIQFSQKGSKSMKEMVHFDLPSLGLSKNSGIPKWIKMDGL